MYKLNPFKFNEACFMGQNMFCVYLKRMCFLVLFGEVFYKDQVGQVGR